MNAVNKKVSSHSRIRLAATRRNQDGGILRKTFLEHLRITERRLSKEAKENCSPRGEVGRATDEINVNLRVARVLASEDGKMITMRITLSVDFGESL